ncbi:MAG: iron ABC transporter permease [Halobacteriovoraceae bacterium]|jgi:iron complex transport system permease protein|nr:iron ABC transporter permease [Halobacteriovoraceae bacterium]
MKNQTSSSLVLMIFVMVLSMTLLMIWGSVKIPFPTLVALLKGQLAAESPFYKIFWDIRIPKIIVCLFAGSALAVSGLFMQTFFQNPLAGPFVLGVHSGSSVGVAVLLMGSAFFTIPDGLLEHGVTFFSIMGAMGILGLLLILSLKVSGKVYILIFGLLFSYLSSGIINILFSISESEKIKSYLLWTLGSFQRVTGSDLIIYSGLLSLGLALSLLMIKPLNSLLAGDDYARSIGVNLVKIRIKIILITALLSGIVTAYCGPVAFLGIMVPHVAKRILNTHDHKILIPGCMIIGAIFAMLAEFFANLFPAMSFPINSILGLVGAPTILLFLYKRRSRDIL